MALGSGFAPPVLGPIHAVGNQGNHTGIHQIDRALKTKGKVSSLMPAKARMLPLHLLEHPPIDLLSKFGIPNFIGMGQSVSTRTAGTPDGFEGLLIHRQSVADVVKA